MMRKHWIAAAIAIVLTTGVAPVASAATSREVTIPGNDVWSGCVDPVSGTGLNGATSGGNGYSGPAAQGCTQP
jgi:hypothetical protein